MRVICQKCGRTAEICEAAGWRLDHWLGYRFEEKEVLKLGICSSCWNKHILYQTC